MMMTMMMTTMMTMTMMMAMMTTMTMTMTVTMMPLSIRSGPMGLRHNHSTTLKNIIALGDFSVHDRAYLGCRTPPTRNTPAQHVFDATIAEQKITH
eukprot:13477069-Alexandrium_andersonii.AAC.1